MPKAAPPATSVTPEQVISYRLQVHNQTKPLPTTVNDADLLQAASVCGLQNSPPGAWEIAMFNRLHNGTKERLHAAIYQRKSLLQAWSLRGVPLIFPTAEAPAFLAALQAQPEEQPWIYTRGITLALEHLQMSFEQLLPLVQTAAPVSPPTKTGLAVPGRMLHQMRPAASWCANFCIAMAQATKPLLTAGWVARPGKANAFGKASVQKRRKWNWLAKDM